MTLTESELNTLRQMITQDKALLTRVQDAATMLDVAQIMAQVGCAHGLPVTAEALLPHIEKAALQQPQTELTETQLTEVAGGATYTINLTNRTPPNGNIVIFQRAPGAFATPDQRTLDWMRSYWFSRP